MEDVGIMYYMAIWSILRPFGIFCGHLVYFMVIWYIFSRFGKKNLATLHWGQFFNFSSRGELWPQGWSRKGLAHINMYSIIFFRISEYITSLSVQKLTLLEFLNHLRSSSFLSLPSLQIKQVVTKHVRIMRAISYYIEHMYSQLILPTYMYICMWYVCMYECMYVHTHVCMKV
jgi:hypothetical protein